MSFAVVHMDKCGKGAVKGIQIHNQRERESKTNADIDKDRSHLNYDLHNDGKINYNAKINDIIENNIESKRAIKADAVVMCNFIITSDSDYFKGFSSEETRDFFEKSYDYFKERYGEKNIIAAKVHMDEKTPHMHLSLVPVIKDKKKGITKLCAKELFDKAELKELQTDYPDYMRKNGHDLERGTEGNNREHIETQKYKRMELEKEVKGLETEIKESQKILEKLLDDKTEVHRASEHIHDELKALVKIKNDIEDISTIQPKKIPLGGLIVKEKDFELLSSNAKRAISENVELKNECKKLKESNDTLKNAYENTRKQLGEQNNRVYKLSEENRELKNKDKKNIEKMDILTSSMEEILKEKGLGHLITDLNTRIQEKSTQQQNQNQAQRQGQRGRELER